MQKWEYLYILKARGLADRKKGEYWVGPDDWINSVMSPMGVEKWEGDNFVDLLNRLGDQGWELVSVSPRSDVVGGLSTIAGAMSSWGGTGVGQTTGSTVDLAGFTGGEIWAFKRPKS